MSRLVPAPSRRDDRRPTLVIEPANGAEIAAITVHAHGLTARERQIAQLFASGCTTAGIAQRLHVSTHTVRDYVKSIFGKVGVRTRGELVATLTAVHGATAVAPRHPRASGGVRGATASPALLLPDRATRPRRIGPHTQFRSAVDLT